MSLKVYIENWKKHLNHIDPIDACQKQIYGISKKLKPGENEKIKYTIMKLNMDYILYNINEINTNIIYCLRTKSYSTAEILSRSSCEFSANLMYVISGKDNDNAKSLLKDYHRNSKNNVKKWLEYAEENKLKEEVFAAKLKIKIVDIIRESMPSIFSGSIPRWPSTQEKFRSIGLESAYHHIFAPASNSTHSLSEDIYQLLYRESLPSEEKTESISAYFDEKASFAIYLSALVVGLFAECVARCCIKAERDDLLLDIITAAAPVNKIIEEHDEMVDDI
ncbi:DUF5677 domain-containing protein [Reinekea thalattae]|uniref:Uncharacterized protein n=1 Tax=Reinekea thalattae TaxID=2593301 RepID=A0A5C8Z8W4_9GAMM|nr:DUF5677 domain-containing protein [Reinekea thalattae]TXR53683.1 hypothetical protein FME95_03740 [Reinekea thalattae]